MRMTAAALAIASMSPATAMAADLAVGQTRACISANPAQKLHVTVGRLVPFGDTTAVSVTLYNTAQGALVPDVAHLPIDAKVLAASCPAVEAESLPLSPDFEGGFAQWQQANGGVFTISVEQIYGLAETQMTKARQEGGLNVH